VICFAVLGILLAGVRAAARETEEQLLQRIQSEPNPVKKAKIEIKLASLKLAEVQDAYTQGHVDAGVKLLGTFLDSMKSSWKCLQDSGRKAVKQPDGFRDLEISIRENTRVLQDLGRTVGYFDRAPIANAEQDLEQLRGEVLHALFPERTTPQAKPAPPASAVKNPGSTPEAR
jgi:hypothetical protein